MKKRIGIWLLGVMLVLSSLPYGVPMILEILHQQQMNASYIITNLNKGIPPSDAKVVFHGHVIEIKEILTNEKSHKDPWKNHIGIGDLSIIVNGKVVGEVRDRPIRVEEEGLNRYHGEIAYLTLEDKKRNQTQLVVLWKKTREVLTEKADGSIVGSVPTEKLTYSIVKVNEDGRVETKQVQLNQRDRLETEMLNAGYVVPHTVGYYTDAWEGYPTLFFPFLYPFITLLLGFILAVFYFPFRNKQRTDRKEKNN